MVTRFNTLVLAIVLVTLAAVAGIVAVSLLSSDGSAATVTTIIGFCATITASMLAILKGEHNSNEIRATRDVVSQKLDQTNDSVKEIERKVNGNLEAAIEQAVQAERHQLIAATAMPKSADELEALLRRAVRSAMASGRPADHPSVSSSQDTQAGESST